MKFGIRLRSYYQRSLSHQKSERHRRHERLSFYNSSHPLDAMYTPRVDFGSPNNDCVRRNPGILFVSLGISQTKTLPPSVIVVPHPFSPVTSMPGLPAPIVLNRDGIPASPLAETSAAILPPIFFLSYSDRGIVVIFEIWELQFDFVVTHALVSFLSFFSLDWVTSEGELIRLLIGEKSMLSLSLNNDIVAVLSNVRGKESTISQNIKRPKMFTY